MPDARPKRSAFSWNRAVRVSSSIDQMIRFDMRRAHHYLLAGVMFVLLGYLFFAFSGQEDCYITYWASHTLSSVGEILNYNGARVEQSSSLASTVILAALEWVTGGSPVAVGAITGIAFGVLTIVAVGRFARRIAPAVELPAIYLTAVSPQLLFYGFSGMETTLVALAIVLVASAFMDCWQEKRGAWWKLAGGALLLLTVRPEKPIVLAAALFGTFAVWIAAARRTETSLRWRRIAATLGVFAAITALIVGFRWMYFGRLMPLPVSAKSGSVELGSGLTYLLGTDGPFRGALIFVLILAVIETCRIAWRLFRTWEATEALLLFPGMLVCAELSFILFSGGDWMMGGRFFAGVLPLAHILALRLIYRSARASRIATIGLFAASAVGIYLLAIDNNAVPLAHRGYQCSGDCSDISWSEQRNVRYRLGREIAKPLADVVAAVSTMKGTPANVLSARAGTPAYYLAMSGVPFRFYDRVGLTTADFVDCPLTGSKHQAGGLGLRNPLRWVLEHAQALKDSCGISPPDVILETTFGAMRMSFDSKEELGQALAAKGYTIVYSTSDADYAPPAWPFVAKIANEIFIAVKTDFVHGLPTMH